MWRIVAWALVLLAPLPAARALDADKKEGQDLNVSGNLSADDPKDKMTKHAHKVHDFKMKAGSTYIIDLKSRQFDCFLRLEDSSGKQLAHNDDVAQGDLNSRIVHKATKDDTYKIIATSFDGKVGAYTLNVTAATGAFAKLSAIKDEFQKGALVVQQRAFAGGEVDIEKYYDGIGELQAKFLDRYLQFAEENAKDSAAGEAKSLIRQMVSGMGKSGAAVIGEKLRSLITKTEDKELLGPASLALGQHLAKRYESAFQKKDAAAAEIAKEAQAVLATTEKGFPALSADAKEALFDLTKLSVGRKAMEIDGEDIDGQKFKLSDYRGKVVVIDFWGDW